MELEQQREWCAAQEISVSIDLVKAAKTHLKFLAAVDKNRFMYKDHVLQRAIYRYNAFWLPLLAKYSDSPLVVPLDCEWIWHCHRLNPVRYIIDCKKLFGRLLSNHNVISSVHATSKSTTEEIWSKMYPEEPYELDLNISFSEDVLKNESYTEKSTSYDLLAAVKRQISFTYQVVRPHMSDDLFLQEAAARYKGFLHLSKANSKTSKESFCVPTYDIDLMWHTHQLYPVSYCTDMVELVGFVVQHDDTDPNRSKGGKLHNGFSETTKQWEQTFGFGYWKAGAMYKGSAPTPITQAAYKSSVDDKEFKAVDKFNQQIEFPIVNSVEVIFDFLDIRNLPEEYKENLLVELSKKQPDTLFSTKRSLSISSNLVEKQVAMFQCEPTGEFLLELVSSEHEVKSVKRLGSCCLSLEDLLAFRGQRFLNKWVAVDLVSGLGISDPILLHLSVSFTPPTPAPQVFQLVRSETVKNDKIETLVLDLNGNKIMSLHNRNVVKDATKCNPDFEKEVYYITDSGEQENLLEFRGNYWSVKGTHGSFKLQTSSGNDDSLFELVGQNMVKLFPGSRLDFEHMQFENQDLGEAFITAVEFSIDYPYGKAVALIDLKSETIKVTDEWIVLPCIALTFTLSNIMKGEGQIFDCTTQSQNKMDNGALSGSPCSSVCGHMGGCLMSKVAKNGALSGSPCSSVCGHMGGCLMSKVAKNGALSGSPCSSVCGHMGGCLMSKVAKNGALSGSPCSSVCGHMGGCLMSKVAKSGELSGSPCSSVCGHMGGCLMSKVAKSGALSGSPCSSVCGHMGGCLMSKVAKNEVLYEGTWVAA